jgi:transcriptional regulator with XRE-family HTH domain
MTTGISLRIARVRARLRQADVAAALGCSRSRVGQIENLTAVPAQWVGRYRWAVSAASADGATHTYEKAASGVTETAKEAGRGATPHSV